MILALFSKFKHSLFLFCWYLASTHSVIGNTIVVAKDGSGNFTSIQAAIESLPVVSDINRTILVKNGIYNEKIYIDRHHLTILGESKPVFGINKEKFENSYATAPSVIILQSIARDEWRCENIDDWGAATLNVRATDIKLENLTVINDFGYRLEKSYSFDCTSGGNKEIRKDGHQFALRCMPTTRRFEAIYCNFYSRGGDTASPWDADQGTFYFADCTMEGAVDFYCPRGWAYAERCHFICYNLNAAIWHDGTSHEDSKSVLKDCSFEGVNGYKLGRYHRPAQMYLINCDFSADMADAEIYSVFKDSTIQWGHRIYYYNSHHKPKDYSWHKNNISKKLAKQINKAWTLGNIWNSDLSSSNPISNLNIDSTAERMLLAQTYIGGWPKILAGKQPIPYTESWSPEYLSKALQSRFNKESTIDNEATSKEIKYLAIAYQHTKNEKYKNAVLNGLNYLIRMQYPNGGFPQYFPDTSGYYRYITFNDQATIRVMELFLRILEKDSDFNNITTGIHESVQQTFDKGLKCILMTQLSYNGKKSIWAAQYHHKSLEPAKARAYEHASYASAESVGIVQFLMKIKNPSTEIKEAIHNAIQFLDKIKVYDKEVFAASSSLSQSVLKDVKPSDPLWSRFYDLKTLLPIFSGRDGIIKYKLAEIEAERRDKYKWYGDWPVSLFEKYIQWNKKWEVPSKIGVTGNVDTGFSMTSAKKVVFSSYPLATLPVLNLTRKITEKNQIVYHTIGNRSLRLNIVEPSLNTQKNKKSIMVVHGGGWRTGNKEMHTDLAKSLANKGYTCFLPEYRLSTEALYPIGVQDLIQAVKFIKDYAIKNGLDSNGITIMGFSAGAMLVSLIGQKPNVPSYYIDKTQELALHSISSIINLDGILAFIHPESGEGDDSKSTSAATYWFGYNKFQRPDIWREGSALSHAGAQSPPTLFISSAVTRMHAGRSNYIELLNKYNIYTEVHDIPDSPHSFVFFQPWYDPMVDKIDKFLTRVYSK